MYKPVVNEVFDSLDNCKLCGKHCSTGTARAEHARKHVRDGLATETREPERRFEILSSLQKPEDTANTFKALCLC